MTLDRIVSKKDFALGLVYIPLTVAVSRVIKKPSGLLFKTGFDYERV